MTDEQKRALLGRIEEMLDMEGMEVQETAGTENVKDEGAAVHRIRLDGSRVITISTPAGSYE